MPQSEQKEKSGKKTTIRIMQESFDIRSRKTKESKPEGMSEGKEKGDVKLTPEEEKILAMTRENKVLNYLKDKENSLFGIDKIAKEIGLSSYRVNSIIKELSNADVIEIEDKTTSTGPPICAYWKNSRRAGKIKENVKRNRLFHGIQLNFRKTCLFI